MKASKYIAVFTLPVVVYISFLSKGIWTFSPVIYSFCFIPLLELFFKPDTDNSKAKHEENINSKIFDWLLYLMFPIQYCFLILFLFNISEVGLTNFELLGRISGMGILCGVLGINVAHELGHRKNKTEQFLAKGLLMTSLYMHFFIEHNRGHHKHVSTYEDPNSARLGEILYIFWLRSIVGAYLSAWKISFEDMKKGGKSLFSLSNEMVRFQLVQLLMITIVIWIFGVFVASCFVLSAILGVLLLETVNYIEHYGLSRLKKENNQYERVSPSHSWNSNHIVGRSLLFELSRHSDHHFLSNRKYQALRHMDDSPQMPTGYPGMMVLSTIPPLWFMVVHRSMKFQDLL